MSASFSKHTFSLSIFRTVTCNKVIKERRRSCVFVSDFDLGMVSFSGSQEKKNASTPLKRALLLFVSFVRAVVIEFVSGSFCLLSHHATYLEARICPSCSCSAVAAAG